ncbi:MAG: anti-sigma factor [Flavobacteriaceae bacterium]
MMKKIGTLLFLAISLSFLSCNDNDDTTTMTTLTIDFTGLEPLGNDYAYEGWLIVNGSPVSTGVLRDLNFPQTLTVNSSDLSSATTFVLSIEPAIDSDPAPAATKILAGDFSGNSASLSSAGIVGDFSPSTGKYILATPTDGAMTNEESGVWFLDNTTSPPTAGLSLPTLTPGWKYEGWAVIGGTPVSTGTFTNVAATDDSALFSGPTALPSPNGADGFFPGEDFLINAPAGMTFPVDLRGATIVISVEPSPDNSAAPFTLKPLAHMIPASAALHTPITMGAGPVVSLTGTVTRQ